MGSIDISFPIRDGMPGFPGDPPVSLRRIRALERGDAYNLSALAMSAHAGTHIDPPSHFFAGGPTIDEIDLDRLNGPCTVVRVGSGGRSVRPEDVDRIPVGAERVLFRTSNSERWKARPDEFFADYVALSVESADRVVERGIRLVGLDAFSIESDGTGAFPVHHRLLGAGTLILEGLQLQNAPAGAYELGCLPLRLAGGDGGPCRAVLWGR